MWNTWFFDFIKNMVIWIKNTEDLKEKIFSTKVRVGTFQDRYVKSNCYGVTFVAPSAWTDKKKVLSGFWNHHLHKPILDAVEPKLESKSFVFIINCTVWYNCNKLDMSCISGLFNEILSTREDFIFPFIIVTIYVLSISINAFWLSCLSLSVLSVPQLS